MCDFRGVRYLQNKAGFRNRQVHIHTDLKWSSQEQSGLEMPRLAPGWSGHTLRGPQWPHVAPTGLSRGVWAIQRPVGTSQGHSVSLRTTSGQYEYVLVSFRNPVLFCKYLSPLKSHKIGSVFKIYIWISVFREKKQYRNLFIGSRDIKQTNI